MLVQLVNPGTNGKGPFLDGLGKRGYRLVEVVGNHPTPT